MEWGSCPPAPASRGAARRAGDRREELLAGAVDYVLDRGLAGLSLRPLAAALGTSDRMLVYYFTGRDQLVAAVLERTAARLQHLLEEALPPHPAPPGQVLGLALAAAGQSPARDLLRLWVQVAGLAAQGDPTCLATARTVTAGWLAWLTDRLDSPPAQRQPTAAALLVIIDGLVLQAVLGQDENVAAGAETLTDLLAQTSPSRQPT